MRSPLQARRLATEGVYPAVHTDRGILPRSSDPGALGSDPSALGSNETALGSDPSALGSNETALGSDPSALGADLGFRPIDAMSRRMPERAKVLLAYAT